jgi:hypothetical protein
MANLAVQDAIVNVPGGLYTVRVSLFDANGMLISEATSPPVSVADPGPLNPQVQVPAVRVQIPGQGGGQKGM